MTYWFGQQIHQTAVIKIGLSSALPVAKMILVLTSNEPGFFFPLPHFICMRALTSHGHGLASQQTAVPASLTMVTIGRHSFAQVTLLLIKNNH